MSYSRRQSTAYDRTSHRSPQRRSPLTGLTLRLVMAGGIVLFFVVTFYAKSQTNPVTGEVQRVDMSVKDEIALGLQSVPTMGKHSLNRVAQAHVEQIGFELYRALEGKLYQEGIEIPYPFQFHLLADRKTVNAFALPGGQVFITEALYRALGQDGSQALDGRLAGVLGHEMGHVINRHGSEQMAKVGLMRGVVAAAGVAGGDVETTRLASYVGNLVNMKYGRADELESDSWGVELMVMAGYNPAHMIEVMDVLEASSGGGAPPEFMSTHPRPANRKLYIQEIIDETFPDGIPVNLQ